MSNTFQQAVAQVARQVGVLTGRFDRNVWDDPMIRAPQLTGAYAAGDNEMFSLDGLNAADGDAVMDTGGGYKITVTTTDNDEVAVVNNANAQNWVPTVAQNPAYLALIETDADDTTAQQLLIGLGSDDDGDAMFDCGDGELDPVAAPVDSLFAFSYDTDDTDANWMIQFIDNAGTLVEVDTGVAFAAATRYLIAVELKSGYATYYIQRESYALKTYQHTTAIGTLTNVIGPVCGLSILSTATRDLFLRKHAFAADFA